MGDLKRILKRKSFCILISIIILGFFIPQGLSRHVDNEFNLTIIIYGNGCVIKNPDLPRYLFNSTVKLTANADDGNCFAYWDGDLSGNENPITITIDSNKTIIAYFHEFMRVVSGGGGNNIINVASNNQTIPINPMPIVQNPPVAFINGPYQGLINQEIIFNGSLSHGEDSDIVTWEWDFGDGTTGYGETVPHVYISSNTYSVVLTVFDDNNLSDSDNTIVEITQPNKTPEIPQSFIPFNSKNNNLYSFEFISINLDKDFVNYIIDWGNGSVDSTSYLPSGLYISMLHKWMKLDNYKITVTAFNEDISPDSETNVVVYEKMLLDNVFISVLGFILVLILLTVLIYIKKSKS